MIIKLLASQELTDMPEDRDVRRYWMHALIHSCAFCVFRSCEWYHCVLYVLHLLCASDAHC